MGLSYYEGKSQTLDLSFRDSLVVPGGTTVQVGKTYDLYIKITNQGSDLYDGMVYFHGLITTDFSKVDIINPSSTFALDSIKGTYLRVFPTQTIIIRKKLYISDKYFKVDSNNIVIIWPSGKNKPGAALLDDNNVTNNISQPFKVVYVEDLRVTSPFMTGASIKKNVLGNDKAFISYPNPADNVINLINFNNLSGDLLVTDLNGRKLIARQIEEDEERVTIPLKENQMQLSEGIYFIHVNTLTTHYVYKFLIKH